MPQINLSEIDIDRSVQVRAKLNEETVVEYTEHITAKRPPMPPVVVFGPDSRGKYFLSEGWHRVAAHRKAGRTAIQATIRDGGWKEALEHALGSNAQHGLRRSNADKRRAVELALKHWPTWSQSMIADKCGVHVNTVATIKPQVPQNVVPDKIIGKDGKEYPARPPMHHPKRPPPSQPPEDEEIPTSGKPPSPDVQRLENGPPPVPTPEPPPLPLDRLGRTVPPHLVPLWERRKEVQEILDELSRIHKAIQQAQDDRDPLYFGAGQGNTPVNFSQAISHLKQARSSIKEAMPYAVCPMCQGSGCRNCSGNGLISKFRYDTIIPAAKKVKQ